MDEATERAGEALEQLAEGPARRAAEAIEAVFERSGAAVEQALERAARGGEVSFARMTEAILRDLARLTAEQVIARPLEGLIARSLGELDVFGARAAGGPVTPGGRYLVGEQGPEMFVPSQAGRIEPAGAGAGAVTVNLTLAGGRSGEASQPVSQARLARALARAVQRGRRIG